MNEDDFLGLGANIVEYLKKQQWPDVRSILLESELASLQDQDPPYPSYSVMWGGFEVQETGSDSRLCRIRQQWDIIATVQDHTGEPWKLEQAGGKLMYRAIKTLLGWTPEIEKWGQLELLANGLPIGFSEDGSIGYYPLRFGSYVVLKITHKPPAYARFSLSR